jgi:hypothetical protein
MIKIKRIDQKPENYDGFRVLIESYGLMDYPKKKIN